MSTVSLLHRSTQAHCHQICRKETLEYGIAYYSPDWPELPEVQQYREVLIEDSANIPQIYEEAIAHFAAHGLQCQIVAPALDQPVDELGRVLQDKGYARVELVAMVLRDWPQVAQSEGVRVLPARAMRAAFRETYDLADAKHALAMIRTASAHVDARREVGEERLNDASYDMFVATVNKQPVGRCAMYQVGDIARVMDLVVGEAYLDRGVGEALLSHVVQMAKRLALPNIVTLVDCRQAGVVSLLRQFGFVADGDMIEFQRGLSPAGRPA